MASSADTTRLLYKISSDLTSKDLQNLKHLCHERIPLGELEKATQASSLFQIMLQKRLIRPENLSFLEGLLKQIGRADLAGRIQSSGRDVTMQTESALGSNSVDRNYRAFLMKLSDELTRDNVESLKFVANLPDGIEEKVQNGKDLFKCMIQRESLGPCKLEHLAAMLKEIHRRDLAEKVKKFQSEGGVSPSTSDDQPPPLQVNNQGQTVVTQPPPGRQMVTGKQPTMHQMGESRPPSVPLLSPSYFSRAQTADAGNVEPRYPVQAMPNPAEILAPMQQLGVDEEEAMPSYPMMNRPRGIALIISNEHFQGNPDLRDRQGNEKDVEHLRELWEFLNFQVIVRPDLDSGDMYDVLRGISTMDHREFDCFVCCLLSHGANGGIYGTDSTLVEIKDITSMFKGVACPSLAHKPKLFFIQACRGLERDRGAPLFETDAVESNPEDAMRHNAEPNESHFLLGYATPPGYVSWRSQVHGSWYVSKLCEVFRKYCERFDVMTMMVKVNDEVSDAFTRQGYKQCPAPVVTLRKRIYFNNN